MTLDTFKCITDTLKSRRVQYLHLYSLGRDQCLLLMSPAQLGFPPAIEQATFFCLPSDEIPVRIERVGCSKTTYL